MFWRFALHWIHLTEVPSSLAHSYSIHTSSSFSTFSTIDDKEDQNAATLDESKELQPLSPIPRGDDPINLRLQHNASQPVNRLPPELLQTIFGMMDIDGEGWPDELTVWPPAVMLVCGYWLRVALGTSALRAELDIEHAPALALYLSERFTEGPLRIDWHTQRPKGPSDQSLAAIGQILSKHTARFTCLRISLRTWHKAVEEALCQVQQHAPALQLLVIEFYGSEEVRTSASIIARFCSLDAPALKLLTISPSFPCIRGSNIMKSPCLRKLTVRRGQIDRVEGTTADIIASLETLPMLECLTLDDCLPVERGPRLSTSVAALPSLREISLHGKTTECTLILEDLLLHRREPFAKLEVECYEADNKDFISHMVDLWRLIQANYRRPDYWRLQIMLFRFAIMGGEPFKDRSGNRVLITLRNLLKEDDFPPILLAIDRLFKQTKTPLSTLTLSGWPDVLYQNYRDEERLRTILSIHPSVQHLRILGDDCVAAVLKVLGRAADDPGEDPASKVLPNMVSMEIRDAVNGERFSWFDMCRAVVERRRQASSQAVAEPIFQSLTFKRCHGIGIQELEALRTVVPWVHVAD
ncbi:hypothetical protein PUNSTDRAFT_45032 [Punctularia strigosozonata HHB-11173 SS5]|uniref:uncharacterized protein n=1 Tax=Punctularia strigosozonata (strain HHB-11173) TaxID=741275 RepID=UPI00044176F7|nr:uncharacterized protein PUNSTDRAFT_45032 [Punctularia strigosozonata HHB-11173 SS5]EIN08560.1 hypothetical protein PUNSTDRAFT_45032 [Punctularia strigosozonata HHB-11173 SS5]